MIQGMYERLGVQWWSMDGLYYGSTYMQPGDTRFTSPEQTPSGRYMCVIEGGKVSFPALLLVAPAREAFLPYAVC